MRRLLVLFLSLLLLLCSCEKPQPAFTRAENGEGYTDTKRNIFYTTLEKAYEPAKAGEVRGVYTDKTHGTTVTFREIPSLDPALFVTDEDRTVFVSDPQFKTAEQWTVKAVLSCDEDAVSIEKTRLSAGSDDEDIATVLALWFDGEGIDKDAYTILSLQTPQKIRRIKLISNEYPNLYYCFSLHLYENGEAYFVDLLDKRAVAVPTELAEALTKY